MKQSFYLAVFAACLVVEYGLGQAAPPSAALLNSPNEDLQPLKRVARQIPEGFPPPPEGMPPPPDGMPPPPDGMPGASNMKVIARRRREAKGGGSIPTRKG